eukprot:5430969-Amphidinium_carterae.1
MLLEPTTFNWPVLIASHCTAPRQSPMTTDDPSVDRHAPDKLSKRPHRTIAHAQIHTPLEHASCNTIRKH